MGNNDFTQGSITKKLLRFMLPVLGALILQAMYGAVDILIVGRFGSKDGISAISTGSSLINLVTFTISGLSMGVTVLIGRYLGEQQQKRIGRVIGGAITFFTVIGLFFTVVLLLLARQLSLLMQAPPSALPLTITYVQVCGAGMLLIIAYNVISAIFRGLGDSNLPLLFVAIACVVNIIGDFLLVAVFKLNVLGAAIATVTAQGVSVVLSILILRRRSLPFVFSRKDIGFNREIKRFVIIGLPIAFQEIMTELSFLALVAFINNLGIDASSGYGIANKIVSFVMLIPGALMQSISPFVAQNVGAHNEDRALKTMIYGMAIGASIGVIIGLLSFFKGDVLSCLFTNDPGAIERSAQYLKGFALEAVVTCILFSFMGYYNGHELTLFVMLQGLAQTFIVRLPMSYIMSIQPNASLTAIGLAAPSATIFGIIINVAFFIFYFKPHYLRES